MFLQVHIKKTFVKISAIQVLLPVIIPILLQSYGQ